MIKQILYNIAAEPSTKNKIKLVLEQKDNELLKKVFYMAESKRVKFHIKKIPYYVKNENRNIDLDFALSELDHLSNKDVTGNDASNFLHGILEALSPNDAYVIERVIGKDLRLKIGTKAFNTVWPKLIEETYYMGAESFNAEKAREIFSKGKGAISEIKADGRYCNSLIMKNTSELLSRQGEETLLGGGILMEELSRFDDCVLNGELVIKGIKREISNGLIASIIDITKKLNSEDPAENKKGQISIDKMMKRHGYVYSELLDRITYIVWDILDIEEYFTNTCNVSRKDRLDRLKKVLEAQSPKMIELVEHKFVYTYEEAIKEFSEALERGEEGTILKDLDGVWKNGKRYNQIKMKVEFDLDLKIVAFNYGNKGTKNENVISSVTCESSCGKLTAKAQGMKEEMMEYITENQEALLGTIAEVKCNGLSSNRNGGNSVLYPCLSKLRDDKSEANSFEECLQIDSAAKGLKDIIKQ